MHDGLALLALLLLQIGRDRLSIIVVEICVHGHSSRHPVYNSCTAVYTGSLACLVVHSASWQSSVEWFLGSSRNTCSEGGSRRWRGRAVGRMGKTRQGQKELLEVSQQYQYVRICKDLFVFIFITKQFL